jgi:2-oxoglutarate ferredoxin oxidoreductase subunit delta
MIHGRVLVDAQRCKGCGLCVAACPQAVLVLSEAVNAKGYHPVALLDEALLDEAPRHCTGCAVCALVCPDVAITVYRAARVFAEGPVGASRAGATGTTSAVAAAAV